MDTPGVIQLVILVILVAMSAFFSSAETALTEGQLLVVAHRPCLRNDLTEYENDQSQYAGADSHSGISPYPYVILVILVAMSAFFSSAETALTTLSNVKVRAMVDENIMTRDDWSI